uniref:Uncharacterized protein n=1 Tax=Wuchereria bancrofti TaxID=6293 RepID=A0AAF5Q7I4_WUCBA
LIDERDVIRFETGHIARSADGAVVSQGDTFVMDLVIAGCDSGKRILMIDMDGCEIEVENFAECIRIGLQVISHVIHAINKVKDSCDRLKRQVDECDAPVETKVIAAGDYLSKLLD